MKNNHKFWLIAVALAVGFAFSACDMNDMQDTHVNVVETKYRFTGGNWKGIDQAIIPGAVSTLDEKTLTVSGGGVSIFYVGVNTQGGGTFMWGSLPFSWAYLHDGSGKIGFVMTDTNENIVVIGKTMADYYIKDILLGMYGITVSGLSSKDMQNTQNGRGFKE